MFSLSKILALAAIIGAVFAAYRFIGRLQAPKVRRRGGPLRSRGSRI